MVIGEKLVAKIQDDETRCQEFVKRCKIKEKWNTQTIEGHKKILWTLVNFKDGSKYFLKYQRNFIWTSSENLLFCVFISKVIKDNFLKHNKIGKKKN